MLKINHFKNFCSFQACTSAPQHQCNPTTIRHRPWKMSRLFFLFVKINKDVQRAQWIKKFDCMTPNKKYICVYHKICNQVYANNNVYLICSPCSPNGKKPNKNPTFVFNLKTKEPKEPLSLQGTKTGQNWYDQLPLPLQSSITSYYIFFLKQENI